MKNVTNTTVAFVVKIRHCDLKETDELKMIEEIKQAAFEKFKRVGDFKDGVIVDCSDSDLIEAKIED